MVDDHTDLNEANLQRAKKEERYRDEVSRGGDGTHKPCEKFPIEEARERDSASDNGMKVPRIIATEHDDHMPSRDGWETSKPPY